MFFILHYLTRRICEGKTVLIVDSDKTAVQNIEDICNTKKMTCVSAENFSSAQLLFPSLEPFVIFVSADFARLLPEIQRTIDDYKYAFFVILAEEKWAGSKTTLRRALHASAAHDFIAKPVSNRSLVNLLKRLSIGKPLAETAVS